MTEPKEPPNTFQRLARAAQKYGRAFAPADTDVPPGTTTVALLRERLRAADDALADDLAALAAAALEEGRASRERDARALSDREREWGETGKVREALARAAESWDWKIEHRDRRDFIGPFSIEHAPGEVRVFLGKTRLLALDHPSGDELLAAVKAERARLEADARKEWSAIKEALVARQRSADDTVPWRALVEALSPEGPLRKREASVVFALALLRDGALEPGWILSTRPPSLAHQKEAFTLPRIDRPGNPDKIYALRVDRVP